MIKINHRSIVLHLQMYDIINTTITVNLYIYKASHLIFRFHIFNIIIYIKNVVLWKKINQS